MMTKFRVFDDDDVMICESPVNLDLVQDQKGLHVVATIKFMTKTRVTVTRMEMDFGNRTWNQPTDPTTLDPDDSFVWTFDSHLTEST